MNTPKNTQGTPSSLPPLPNVITALLSPSAYPDYTVTVELIQTHISYVLLTDSFAYKIKKPVDFGFLDFTTLDKRRHFCTEEVRLNRRLAPGLYLGVVEVREQSGSYSIDLATENGQSDGSTVVEYAVKMKRIPKGVTLEERIEDGSVTPELIRNVGARIARFHDSEAETSERISAYGAPEVIKENTDENFSQTESFITAGIIPEETFNFLKTYTDTFLAEHGDLFRARVTGGFIRDCHGDIHAEHVILPDKGEIEIFDCIEFSERFRFGDTVSETAFLSMDLDFRGRPDLATVLEESYFLKTDDSAQTSGGRALLNFYKTYRAYIRGKVEVLKYNESEVSETERAEALFNARHHFYLAARYAGNCAGSECARPALIIVRGLSGTGKSTVAVKLARLTGAELVSSDRVRKEIAGLDASAHSYAPDSEGIYSTDFTERTYAEMERKATEVLARGVSCVLDATYSSRAHIETAREAAQNYDFHIIECTVHEEVAIERIERRAAKARVPGSTASDATVDIYRKQKERFESMGSDTADTKVAKIDTSLDECAVFASIATEIFG
ncbi:MAG: AAA family ATPase [Proteobacteria bacterium]|nr:AAA family ATPase [Pseudomonadota bacterium]